MTTIADLDHALTDVAKRFQQAVDQGDAIEAERLYLELDRLLDERCHCPHDR